MTPQRPTRRARLAREPNAAPSDEATGPAADAADAPDSLGAAGSVQAISPAGRDELAGDIERADEREPGSMEATAHPNGGGGMPGLVESQAREGEGDVATGDPWN